MRYLLWMAVAWGLAACATSGHQRVDARETQQGELSQIQPQEWSPVPSCMRVAPLAAEFAGSAFANDLFESLRGHVAAKGYEIDRTDCSYVLSGQLVKNENRFYGLFSRAEKSARVSLTNSVKNKDMWTSSATVDLSDGGLPFSLLGVSAGVYRASKSVNREHELMAVDSLARKLVASLPYRPPVPAAQGIEPPYAKDFDQWLQSIAEPDRAQALKNLTRGDVQSVVKEKAFVRLLMLEDSVQNRRDWAAFRAFTGDPEGALTLLDQGGEKSLHDAETQFLRGRVHLTLSRFADADAAFVKAIAMNGDQALYFEGLAHANAQRREYARAIAAYSKVLELNPGKPYVHKNIAALSVKGGDLPLALEHYQLAARQLAQHADQQGLTQLREEIADLIAEGLVSEDMQARVFDERAMRVMNKVGQE